MLGKWIKFWDKAGDRIANSCKGDPIATIGLVIFVAPFIFTMVFLPVFISIKWEKHFRSKDEEVKQEEEEPYLNWWEQDY